MDKTLIYPVFVQVLLTFTIGLLAVKSRISAVKQRLVPISHFKHNKGKAPEHMLRLGDNFSNQFELPILFYALIALFLITETQGLFFSLAAWLFIAFRVFHAFIHIRFNHIIWRMYSYLLGALTLMVMWFVFLTLMVGA